MFEAMKIGVLLDVKGDASLKLKQFHQLVQRLNKSVIELEGKLKVTGDTIQKISNHLSRINPKLTEFSAKAENSKSKLGSLNETAANSVNTFSGLQKSINNSAQSLNKLARSAQHAKGELSGLEAKTAQMSAMGGAGGGGRGRKGGIHVHPLSFAGLGFSGGAMAAGGAALVGYKSFKEAATYEQTLAQLEAQNLPGGTKAAANAFVMSHRMRGVSPEYMARALVDAAVITRDYKSAEGIAPTLASMRYANEIHYGENKFSAAQEQAAIKVAELTTGSKDPKILSEAINHMFKVGTGTGLRVMPTDFLAVVRGARGALTGSTQFKNEALSHLNPDFMFYGLESLVQEMGGPGVGRQVGQFYNHILAGRLTTASAKDFESLGLVKPGMAEYNKIGMIKRIKPGGIVGSEKDPMGWVYNVYLPALASKGITNWADIRKHILIDFTNTDASLVQTLVAQKDKILSNIEINKKAKGINETVDAGHEMSKGKIKDVTAAWEAFETAFGKMSQPAVNRMLDGMVTLLDGLTKLVTKLDESSTETGRLKGDGWFATHMNALLFGKSDTESQVAASTQTPDYLQRNRQMITLNIDGRPLAQALAPHLGEMTYHANITDTGRFNLYRDPTVSGSNSAF